MPHAIAEAWTSWREQVHRHGIVGGKGLRGEPITINACSVRHRGTSTARGGCDVKIGASVAGHIYAHGSSLATNDRLT